MTPTRTDMRPLLIFEQIDLPASDTERVTTQLVTTFGIDPAEILHVSAKSGVGVKEVLQAIVHRIPPPSADDSAPLRALLFDSLYVGSVYTVYLLTMLSIA
jgi:translation factor GUF1, mitochondrial